MNFPRLSIACLLLALAPGVTPLSAADPGGQWTPPPANGRPWKHAPTGLAFPPFLADYRFTGHFEYADGGVLLRYENLNEQARLDVFLFKAGGALASVEDQHRRLLKEMETVAADMETMAKQGRYRSLSLGEVVGGELELWQKQSIPIATRVITATRVGISDQGTAEAVVRQWVGITVLDDHLITIRHMRPASTGDAGEAAMKRLVGLVFQIIKDPSLRSHVRQLVDDYLADPFSADGQQASAAVLAYLNQTPYFPISIPEEPVAAWLEHCKAVAPGTEDHLLRAFMLGAAKAAFEDADAETCLREGARQFAKVYRKLVAEHPGISRPEMEQFVTAAEKGQGHTWLKEHALRQ